jgi:hypothetical protein
MGRPPIPDSTRLVGFWDSRAENSRFGTENANHRTSSSRNSTTASEPIAETLRMAGDRGQAGVEVDVLGLLRCSVEASRTGA